MIFKDRLQFMDHCVAGEKTRFQNLISAKSFNSLDRSYEIYRDYIRQKNRIKGVACDVDNENLILHLTSEVPLEELLSENFPKKGVTPVETDNGVDLNIKLIDNVL